MTRKDAIEAIKCNWPDSRYTILREALDMAVKALEDVTDKNVGKMTNADRIRAMNDEELALNIGNGFFGCPQCSQGDCRKCDLECEKHCLEWLQSTAEEADHVV